MVIDFKLGLAEQPQPALGPIVPNKRRRIKGVDGDIATGKRKLKNDVLLIEDSKGSRAGMARRMV